MSDGSWIYPARSYEPEPTLKTKIKYVIGSLIGYPGAGTVERVGCEGCGFMRQANRLPRVSRCAECCPDDPDVLDLDLLYG